MSRTYYTRIDFKRINKYDGGFGKNPLDRIMLKLINFCGMTQILKVESTDENEDGVEYVAQIIMGCSGGCPCQSGVDDLKELFDDDVPVEGISAYYIEDGAEGHYYSDEEE